MTELAPHRMTVEEYLVWARGRPGRHELVDGRPYKMAPETVAHVRVKVLVVLALMEAIEKSGLEMIALGDGATVRISDRKAFEPDALVYPAPELPGGEMIVPNPVIVVEVLSPSYEQRDTTSKIAGYLSLPSIQHYLIVDPLERQVVHHRRTTTAELATKVHDVDGRIECVPPGLSFPVRRCFDRR